LGVPLIYILYIINDCQNGPSALMDPVRLSLLLCKVNNGRELLSLYYLLILPVMCLFICY